MKGISNEYYKRINKPNNTNYRNSFGNKTIYKLQGNKKINY